MQEEVIIYSTSSSQETVLLGKRLGALLKEGDVVALVGELGSGKTWLTKGIALGIGLSPDIVITSPSFAIVNEYKGRCPFYHMDLYRLDHLSDVLSAGLEEYLHGEAVVVMEWADKWPEILPVHTLKAELSIVEGHGRKIRFVGSHPRTLNIMNRLEQEGSGK